MKILHINSEYATNSLHKNLVNSLSNYSISQLVYAPIKKKSNEGKNESKNKGIICLYSKKLMFYHRFLYSSKMAFLLKDIINKIDLTKIDFVHAYKLYSDGGVAYKLYSRYRIPYIVTIRNSDINVFLKYMVHLKPYAKKILLSAQNIVFVSPAYTGIIKKEFSDIYPIICDKFIVIPNGIDSFWHENLSISHKVISYPIRLLFVGRFDKNKNIEAIIKTVKSLGNDYILRIVGGQGNNKHKIKSIALKNSDIIELFPKATKEELLKHYQESHILVMPSFFETFGLVYIEAMSQGLPVIYSNKQGIDGFYNEGFVGYSVNPHKFESIIQAVKEIEKHYPQISQNCKVTAPTFTWSNIAEKFIKLYFLKV